MSHQSIQHEETYGSDVVSLQKALQNTQNELKLNHQKSLELTGVNHELQQQLQEQYAINHTLTANITDLEMQIDLFEAQNQEYQHTINQTNEKYEETIHELSLTHEQLNITTHQLKENEHTMQSLNNDLLHIAGNTPIKSPKNGHYKSHNTNSSNNNINYKQKYEKQLSKYDELLKECQQYRNYYSQQQIELENIKKHSIEFEQKNKQLSEQIVELTYSNVHFEKVINDYSQELDEKIELINYLQNENQNLTFKFTEKPFKTQKIKLINSPNITKTSPNTKAIPTNNKHIFNHSNHSDIDIKDNIEIYESENENENENDLFTMVQNYDNNDEYLISNEEMNLPALQLSNATLSSSPKHKSVKNHTHKHKKLDAQEEYLHLTASAIKIKYSNVEANINELLQYMTDKNVVFYEAYDVLNEYMAKKKLLQNTQSEMNVSVQSKGKVGRLFNKVRRASVTVKDKTIIKIQRSNSSKKSILDIDKFKKNLQKKETKAKLKSIGVTVETINGKNKKKKSKSKVKKIKNKKRKKLQDVIVIKNDENDGEKVKKKVKKKVKRRKSKHKNDKIVDPKVIIT